MNKSGLLDRKSPTRKNTGILTWPPFILHSLDIWVLNRVVDKLTDCVIHKMDLDLHPANSVLQKSTTVDYNLLCYNKFPLHDSVDFHVLIVIPICCWVYSCFNVFLHWFKCSGGVLSVLMFTSLHGYLLNKNLFRSVYLKYAGVCQNAVSLRPWQPDCISQSCALKCPLKSTFSILTYHPFPLPRPLSPPSLHLTHPACHITFLRQPQEKGRGLTNWCGSLTGAWPTQGQGHKHTLTHKGGWCGVCVHIPPLTCHLLSSAVCYWQNRSLCIRTQNIYS